MKKLKLITCAILSVALMSCGGAGKAEANAEGFGSIEKELKGKFGDDAYYTKLTIINIETLGNAVNATVTDDPASMKMGEWNYSQSTWTQNSEITLEVSEGSKPEDFMFKLDDKINLTKLGELVEKSMKQLKTEKDLKNPKLSTAFVKLPRNGDASQAEYCVTLEPEHGGTSFSFYYKLDGELIKMDY